MAARIGRQTTLDWGTDLDITGVRELSTESNGEPVDITSNDNAGVRQLLSNVSAQNETNVSVSGVTKSEVLKDDFYAGTREKTLTITYPSGGILAGTFLMVSYSEGDPYNDAATFEASFQSNGAVTYTP